MRALRIPAAPRKALWQNKTDANKKQGITSKAGAFLKRSKSLPPVFDGKVHTDVSDGAGDLSAFFCRIYAAAAARSRAKKSELRETAK